MVKCNKSSFLATNLSNTWPMTLSISFRKVLPLLPFIIPILCIVISKSSYFVDDPVNLSAAITFDLLISTPVLYFLTIRKSEIPNTTVVPVFILGIIIASFILPIEHQYYLSLVKTWFLPFLELAIITYVILTIRKTFKAIKKNLSTQLDFFTAAKEASGNILPKKLVIPFATELSVFYYGFVSWKQRKLSKNEFSYHKTTSTRMLLVVFIFLILVETFTVHLLLQRWSTVAAWILSAISIYTIFQIFGIAKSLSKRPISIDKDSLSLRYGVMSDALIPHEKIESVSAFTKSVEKHEGYAHLSSFKDMEGHNILIELKEELILSGFYGMKKTYNKILIYLDEPEKFLEAVQSKFNSSERSTPE